MYWANVIFLHQGSTHFPNIITLPAKCGRDTFTRGCCFPPIAFPLGVGGGTSHSYEGVWDDIFRINLLNKTLLSLPKCTQIFLSFFFLGDEFSHSPSLHPIGPTSQEIVTITHAAFSTPFCTSFSYEGTLQFIM